MIQGLFRRTSKPFGTPKTYFQQSCCAYSTLQADLDRVNTKHLSFKIYYDKPQQTTEHTETSQADDKVEEVRIVENTQGSNVVDKELSSSVNDDQINLAIKDFVTLPPTTKTKEKPQEGEKLPEGEMEEINLHKYDELARKLSGVADSSILPYTSFNNKSLKSPYEQLSKLNNNDMSRKTRLSVTKIIPGNWCELQRTFRLYNDLPEEQDNEFMARGRKEHKKFEDETHPIDDFKLMVDNEEVVVKLDHTNILEAEMEIQEPETVKTAYKETDISSDASQTVLKVFKLLKDENTERSSDSQMLAMTWTRNILRLVELYQFGECREVLVHWMYDLNKDSLIDTSNDISNEDQSDLVVISGIIDHLVLESGSKGGVFEGYQHDLKESIKNPRDLSNIISEVSKKSENWCDKDDPFLYISVQDLKTRASRSLPHPKVQLNSKVQVGMYRKFLGLLSENPKLTYQMLLINATKREIDVDMILPPELIIYMMLNNKYLINDFIKLKNGEPIGFTPFDHDSNKIRYNKGYSLGPLYEVSETDSAIKETKKLIKSFIPQGLLTGSEWKTPPTFRYLAARTSQLYQLSNNFLSPYLSIQYSAKDAVFSQTNYRFDDEDVKWNVKKGMDFWLGKRMPYYPQFKTICNRCEFAKQCGWNLDHQE